MSTLEDQIRVAFEPYHFSGDMDRPQADQSRDRRPRRRWAVTFVVAAVIVSLLLVLPIIPPGAGPGGADPAAAAALSRLSTIALHEQPEASPQPGQYVYEKTASRGLYAFVSSGTGISFRYSIPSTDERWLGTDGSGQSRGTIGQPEFLTDADRAAYERYVASGMMDEEWGTFDWGRPYDHRYAPGGMVYFDFSGLPTDVEVLKGMLERREIIGGPAGDWETFNLAADMLTWSYAPPELRAALFEVMADLPGVELTGRTRDASGRVGLAVGYTHDEQRQEVVFERGTARILERRWVSVSGDPEAPSPDDVCSGPPGGCGASEMAISGPPGTVSSVMTYKVYGTVVDHIGDVPRP